MTATILWPDDPGATDACLGGKARALVALDRARFSVPPFFIVAPVTQMDPAALLAACDRLCPDGSLLAVRSSAADEDSSAHSFAGQLDTFLFVPRQRLAEAVAAVRRSAFSERVLAYRREHGIAAAPAPPAILVQRMIDAEVAGVAFSADPTSGRRSTAIVSAVYGLGSSLVSGEADADTFTVSRDGRILSRSIANKSTRHIQDLSAGEERSGSEAREGVRSVPVDPALAAQPALTDQQVLAVAELARRAARHFGSPQDIEWAFRDGQLYLLQSRPITSLHGLADPDGFLQLWDNANIAESYAGITTPLTFSFARHAYEGVYQEFCRLMRVPDVIIADHQVMFANMLGLLRGRIYYNLLNWYRMLALLPGFTLNRRFMEQMMGVKEPLPDELVAQVVAENKPTGKWKDTLHLAAALLGLWKNHFTLQRQIRRFYGRLDTVMAVPAIPLDQQRPDELVGYFRTLERQLLRRWDAPLVNDFFAMIFYGLLRSLSQKIDPEAPMHNDLLCAEGGIVSTEPARRIREMAERVAASPDLLQVLSTADRATAEDALRQDPALAADYRAYLDKFAHRCLEELKLESATLDDDPLPLVRSIAGMAARLRGESSADAAGGGGGGGGIGIEAGMRADAERRARLGLRWHPLRRLLFRWVLRNARARVRERENLRFERTRVFGRVRSIFVELGRRLAAERRLDDPRDIFYLTLEELLGFIEGAATCTDLRALTALRKAEFEAYKAAPAPADRCETRGAVYLANSFQSAAAPQPVEGGDARSGIGCCPGIARGRARVITDPRSATIQQGEILIAQRTDPGWIMLFPAAAGVAVEFGSVLSHSAIVAREMGIPAVVSVTGLTAWIRTGDLLELDGKRGIVRRLEPAPSAATTEATAEREGGLHVR